MKKISLQWVILIPLLGLTLLTLVLVGFFSFRNGQQAVMDVTFQLRQEINNRIEEHLYTFLDTPVRINQANARAFLRGEPDVRNKLRLQQYFWEQIQIFDSITSISFGNPAGGIVNAGREGVDGFLYIINTEDFISGTFRKYATDSYGSYATLLETIPDFDARERSWYKDAVFRGTQTWSEVYILFTGQDMSLTVSLPVYDTSQELLGVVAVNFFLSHLNDFLSGIDVGISGQSFIMERNGLMIASSTDEKPFKEAQGLVVSQRIHAEDSSFPLINGAAKYISQNYGYQSIQYEETFDFPLHGERHFGQITPLTNPYGLDWFIVTVIPEMDFLGQVHMNNRKTVFLMLIMLLIIVGVSYLITRKVIRPISQLTQVAGTLAKGQWDETIEHHSHIEEINTLSKSFNHMGSQLQEMVAGLNQEIAERILIQEELKESEERFKAISDLALDAIIMIDSKGRVVYWSPSAETIFGYSSSQVMGQDVHELLMPEKYKERFQAGFQRFQSTGEGTVVNQVLEITAKHRSGKEIPIEIGVSPIMIKGEFFASAIIRDISGRKMMEREIECQYEFQKVIANISTSFINASRKWIHEAIQNALYQITLFFQIGHAYLFQFSKDGRYLTITHEWFARDKESKMDQFQNLSVSEFPWILSHLSRKEFLFLSDMNEAFQKGEADSQRRESLFCIPLKKDGRIFGFLALGTLGEKTSWSEAEKTLLRVVGEIVSNVFTKFQIEEDLIESETRYRNLVSNVPGVIFRCSNDSQRTMSFISDDIQGMVGYSSQDFIDNKNLSFASILHPLDRDTVIETIKKNLSRKKPYTLNYRIQNHSGTISWIQENGQGVYNEKGDFQFIDGVLLDITEQKGAEEKLDQRTRELEEELDKARQVHERTLPTALPEIEGLSFAAFYQPATKLGGDFYDVIKVGKKLIIYLSDVSGHGLDGSMLSVFVKHTIKGYLTFANPDHITPKDTLKYLATKFQEEKYPKEYFICIFFGVLDLETNEFSYAGAGFQDTPLVRSGDGRSFTIKGKGLFISSFPSFQGMTFKEESISLTSDTTLFIHTDGLSEQYNHDQFYRDRLIHTFYANSALPPQLIAHSIVEDFKEFNDGSLQGRDDITFFILQVEPKQKKEYYFTLTSDFLEIKSLYDKVESLLEESPEKIKVLSSLNEMTANAIEHGNKMDRKKKVKVQLIFFPAYSVVVVEDEGEGFPWQKKMQQPLSLDGTNDRGRGIAMTKLFSDYFTYNERGNRATFMIKGNQE